MSPPLDSFIAIFMIYCSNIWINHSELTTGLILYHRSFSTVNQPLDYLTLHSAVQIMFSIIGNWPSIIGELTLSTILYTIIWVLSVKMLFVGAVPHSKYGRSNGHGLWQCFHWNTFSFAHFLSQHVEGQISSSGS